VSAADQRERSKRHDERSQHELSCPAISHRINRGRRSDSGERQVGRASQHSQLLPQGQVLQDQFPMSAER
jgi:hypothetical protein